MNSCICEKILHVTQDEISIFWYQVMLRHGYLTLISSSQSVTSVLSLKSLITVSNARMAEALVGKARSKPGRNPNFETDRKAWCHLCSITRQQYFLG